MYLGHFRDWLPACGQTIILCVSLAMEGCMRESRSEGMNRVQSARRSSEVSRSQRQQKRTYNVSIQLIIYMELVAHADHPARRICSPYIYINIYCAQLWASRVSVDSRAMLRVEMEFGRGEALVLVWHTNTHTHIRWLYTSFFRIVYSVLTNAPKTDYFSSSINGVHNSYRNIYRAVLGRRSVHLPEETSIWNDRLDRLAPKYRVYLKVPRMPLPRWSSLKKREVYTRMVNYLFELLKLAVDDNRHLNPH